MKNRTMMGLAASVLVVAMLPAQAAAQGLIVYGSYVDVDNDQAFTPDTDIPLVAGELDDGRFDTTVPEGAYTVVIPGAGLVIQIAPVGHKRIDLRAEGDLAVYGALIATKDVRLRAGLDIMGDDRTLIDAGGKAKVRAGDSVLLDDASVNAGKAVQLRAASDVSVQRAAVTATKKIELRAQTIDTTDAVLTARRVKIKAG